MQYILPATIAFLLTIFATFLAIRFFPKWGLMDRPEKYGLKRTPIPYPGGIVLFAVFTICLLLFFDLTLKLLMLLLSAGILVLVSFWDDRHPLPAVLRLGVQVLAAAFLVAAGVGILSISNPLGAPFLLDQIHIPLALGEYTYDLVLFSALFTVIWLVVIANTMNWLDGISGLPSGMTAIGATILFFLSASPIVNQPEVAQLSLVIAAIAFGFWLFDFYPPKILMGDSGAMFFGLLLASLAIFSGGKIATAFLVLGFPILDAVYVGLSRIIKGRAPWKGGEWEKEGRAVHLHHRLLKSGLSHRKVLLLIYALSAIFGVAALFLQTQGKFLAILLMFSVMVGMGALLRWRS